MNPSVLVVDDDPELRQLIHIFFERDGYRVHEAADGEQAIDLAFLCQPSIILLDIMMPTMSGFTVCRALQRDARTRRIPVIFLTALNDPQSHIEGWRLGAADYLTKPLSLNLLGQRVRVALQRSAIASRSEAGNSDQ